MGCDPISGWDQDGRVWNGFICSRRGAFRPPKCRVDGCDADAEYECDFPKTKHGHRLLAIGAHVPEALTCGKRLCKGHAEEVGEDRHYCPPHLARTKPKAGQPELFS